MVRLKEHHQNRNKFMSNGFNSYMVRLKGLSKRHLHFDNTRFNSYMVRLKEKIVEAIQLV